MPKTKQTKSFSLSLALGDKVYKSKGTTFFEALLALPEPTKNMSKAILTISDGNGSAELDYLPRNTKRLYWKNARPTLAKQFDILVGKVRQ